MDSIIEKITQEYKEKFDTTTMFGIPISQIDADGLRACICVLGEISKNAGYASRSKYEIL